MNPPPDPKMPDNLPPLPPDTVYGGTLADYEGQVTGFVYQPKFRVWNNGHMHPLEWDRMKNDPKSSCAAWHIAIPIEAVKDSPALTLDEEEGPGVSYRERLRSSLADKPPEFLPDSHNWPEDFSHENGGYFRICQQCRGQFMGHKRRQLCKVCAQPAVPAQASPFLQQIAEMQEFTKASAKIRGGLRAGPAQGGEPIKVTQDELQTHLAGIVAKTTEPVADSLRETPRTDASKDLYEAIQRLATMVGYSLQAGWHMEDWEIPLVVDIARESIASK